MLLEDFQLLTNLQLLMLRITNSSQYRFVRLDSMYQFDSFVVLIRQQSKQILFSFQQQNIFLIDIVDIYDVEYIQRNIAVDWINIEVFPKKKFYWKIKN